MPSLHQALLVLLYSFLGTISMAVQDFSGTLLNIAEQNNIGKAAKLWDRVGDAARFVMLCYSGDNLMHMGWLGWLGVVPILYFGGEITERSTSLAHEIYPSGTPPRSIFVVLRSHRHPGSTDKDLNSPGAEPASLPRLGIGSDNPPARSIPRG